MNKPNPQDLLHFALDAVWQAGRITLGHFQTGVRADRKADNTPVTIADRQAEQKIRELITKYWPEHGIHGEEFGKAPANSPYTWIIDPIDGTKSFISGVPLYSNLLALMDGDKALLGVINLPALNETVYAVRGGGCFGNGRHVHVSSIDKLENAVALCSEMESMERYGRLPAWQRIVNNTYLQRTWGDGYGYALVATGRAEIMVDPVQAPWDVAPLQVILEEAGGTFTDWRGNHTIHSGEGIATNGLLLDQVLALVNE
ncbi:MAG: inositol monophosphatase family protein [Ardenticatenaceae bacterium]|nr:inositol monophosphatase family protein [Ardenticatenaceae bacterium]MCB9446673.1 inositol monophosphatase family protein [Ardenticatenaceae bacterium]